jgi:hypothetical protein
MGLLALLAEPAPGVAVPRSSFGQKPLPKEEQMDCREHREHYKKFSADMSKALAEARKASMDVAAGRRSFLTFANGEEGAAHMRGSATSRSRGGSLDSDGQLSNSPCDMYSLQDIQEESVTEIDLTKSVSSWHLLPSDKARPGGHARGTGGVSTVTPFDGQAITEEAGSFA